MPPAAPTATAQNSQQAQSNLQSYTGGMQTPDQAMSAANNQFGVSQQQQNVQGLRTSLQNTNNLLNQVAPGVMGRTANSLVSSAQANRQIQNEQAPLNAQYNQENTDYTNANQDYQAAQGQASTLANANLAAQDQHQSYLQGIYNDLYTQEQNAAQLAQEKYAADASVKASAAGASPSFGVGGAGASGSLGSGAAYAPPASPQDAVAQAFQGYSVSGSPQGYTESTIIPALEQYLTSKNPKQTADVIKGAATSLAYNYRKQNFGQ